MKYGLVFLVVGLLLFAPLAIAGQNQGGEKFDLDGGSKGKVPFPHWKHQDTLKDCTACHTLFPKQKGAIQTEKAEQRLKSKQVMNKLCIACHRAEKKAGKPSGPTSCATCHVR